MYNKGEIYVLTESFSVSEGSRLKSSTHLLDKIGGG